MRIEFVLFALVYSLVPYYWCFTETIPFQIIK